MHLFLAHLKVVSKDSSFLAPKRQEHIALALPYSILDKKSKPVVPLGYHNSEEPLLTGFFPFKAEPPELVRKHIFDSDDIYQVSNKPDSYAQQVAIKHFGANVELGTFDYWQLDVLQRSDYSIITEYYDDPDFLIPLLYAYNSGLYQDFENLQDFYLLFDLFYDQYHTYQKTKDPDFLEDLINSYERILQIGYQLNIHKQRLYKYYDQYQIEIELKEKSKYWEIFQRINESIPSVLIVEDSICGVASVIDFSDTHVIIDYIDQCYEGASIECANYLGVITEEKIIKNANGNSNAYRNCQAVYDWFFNFRSGTSPCLIF